MLAGLFSQAWQSDVVEKRLEWIQKVDESTPTKQAILVSLVEQDSELSVRQAALDKLTSPLQAFELSNAHNDVTTRQHASRVLAKLIGVNSNISEQECRDLIKSNPKIKPALAKHCTYAVLRHELIEQLSEAQQSEIIAEVSFTDTRQLIAKNLVSEDALRTAKKGLRGKDTSAEKIIKSKLDGINTTAKKLASEKELADELCAKMELLASYTKWRPEFKGQYIICDRQWQEKGFSPEPSVLARYDSAHAVVSAEVERQIKIEQAQIAQQECCSQLATLNATLATLSIEEALKDKSAHTKLHKDTLERWQQQIKIDEPKHDLVQQFNKAQQNAESALTFFEVIENIPAPEDDANVVDNKNTIKQLKTALKQLNWSSDYPQLTAKTEIEKRIDDLLQSNEQAKTDAKNQLDKLHKRINRLLGNTNRGTLVVARRELEAVQKAVEKYSGKDRAALDERIEKATAAIKKMGDWQDFATEPKYLALCDQMEALQKSTQHPDKLAKKINDLQQKWKAVGQSDSADKHWDRFKLAADQAYEPCSIFFKQRRATRLENLKRREPLVTQMRDLLEKTDWDEQLDYQPDYKGIENELRRISNEWQKIKDVEPKQGQKQWLKLSKFKSAIYAKLDVVYDANIELKNQLIAQALAMLESDIQEQSLTKLQYLQSKWKTIGVTRRKQDQAAWKKFTKATDDVYAKIQGLRKDKRAEEDQQLDAYRSVIKKVQVLAKNTTSLAEGDREFESLQNEYQALPELPHNLPEKLIKGLESDYRRSSDNYSKARERVQLADKAKAMQAVYQYANLCEKLEALGSKATPEQTLKIKTEITELVISDKKIQQRLEQRLDSAHLDDRETYTQTRKELCIDLEILLGADSPSEDRAYRMEIQLQRMQTKGLGHSKATLKDKTDDFKIEWLCLPGAEVKQQQSLNKRFNALIKQAEKSSKKQ